MTFEGAEKLLEISFVPFEEHEEDDENENELKTQLQFLSSSISLSNFSHHHQLPSPHLSDDEDYLLPSTKVNPSKQASLTLSRDLIQTMGLRVIGRETWQEMLNLVKCQILSMITNEYADAYLLSESSLFVYPYKIILKTCGTTTLLLALPRLLQLAAQVCKVKKIQSLFYSRKSFQYPEHQPWPHSSWSDEVEVLDNLFDNGAAYVMGNTNSEPWYLYVVDERPIPSHHFHSSNLPIHYSSNLCQPSLLSPSFKKKEEREDEEEEDDQVHLPHSMTTPSNSTLELLMTGLCPQQMQRYFYATPTTTCPTSSLAFSKETLTDWIPGLVTDSYQFDPCGWSQNGLRQSVYTTIHVTPESECSYASFETNFPSPDLPFIQKVVHVFRPTKLTFTLFQPHKQHSHQQQEQGARSSSSSSHIVIPSSIPSMIHLPGYQLVDLMVNVLPEHFLFYGHYVLEEK